MIEGNEQVLTEEELLREQDDILHEISDIFASHQDSGPGNDERPNLEPSTSHQAALFAFYRERLVSQSKQRVIDNPYKWLESVQNVVNELDACFSSITENRSSIEREKAAMISSLSGLDEKSKRLIQEQRSLEQQVLEIEARLSSVNLIKEVSALSNNRGLLVSDFPKFESIVHSLENISRTDSRQYEHLKSRVCSVAVSVGTSAVELYAKRMVDFINDLEGQTVSTVSIYGKFTDVLNVVGNVATLFGRQADRDYTSALIELEKSFSEAREKIIVPVISDYMQSILSSSPLSVGIRKGSYFVNSIGQQEFSLFKNIFNSASNSESVLSLYRAIGLGLYQPLRTAVISSENVADLRESAEIIRLEVISPQSDVYLPFIQSVVMKLHRDIQERLIYKIESFIRDEIKGCEMDWSLKPKPVVKTFECLELITGVVDSQTFHEIANEAIASCVEVLMRPYDPTIERQVFLVAQLLSLRERITLIDCEYSLLAVQSPPSYTNQRGITDQFRRLLLTPSTRQVPKEQAVRYRIETELKHVCEKLNAGIIARILSMSSNEEKVDYLSKIKADMKTALPQPGLELVLLKPIVAELRGMGTDESVLSVITSRDVSRSSSKPQLDDI